MTPQEAVDLARAQKAQLEASGLSELACGAVSAGLASVMMTYLDALLHLGRLAHPGEKKTADAMLTRFLIESLKGCEPAADRPGAAS